MLEDKGTQTGQGTQNRNADIGTASHSEKPKETINITLLSEDKLMDMLKEYI